MSAAAEAEKTEESSGDLMPNEIAIAEPKRRSKVVAPKAPQRGQIPTISAIPSISSAAVAAHARNGIMKAGMKEFTWPVYSVNLAKFPQAPYFPQRPRRSATADRKAAPSAIRAERVA